MKITSRDVVGSIVTGCTAGFIGWRVAVFLGTPAFRGVSLAWLVLLVPCLWMLGVGLGALLGTRVSFFDRFGRFVAIGFTNFTVDSGVTNLLMAYSGITSGWVFSGFKALAFIVAFFHSYLWNKFWAFESREPHSAAQFVRFTMVALSALLVNVTVASLIVNLPVVVPLVGARVWANLGIAAGSASGLLFSFVGFRGVVFVGRELEVGS